MVQVKNIGVDVRPHGTKESPQVIARIEQLPFPDNSFDVLISNQVFDPLVYHQDHALMMKEIVRVLKRGGIYIALEEQDHVSQIEGFNRVLSNSLHSNPSFKSVYKKS